VLDFVQIVEQRGRQAQADRNERASGSRSCIFSVQGFFIFSGGRRPLTQQVLAQAVTSRVLILAGVSRARTTYAQRFVIGVRNPNWSEIAGTVSARQLDGFLHRQQSSAPPPRQPQQP
jgi:hypothetical protein